MPERPDEALVGVRCVLEGVVLRWSTGDRVDSQYLAGKRRETLWRRSEGSVTGADEE